MDVTTAYLPADVGWHNWGSFFTVVDVWRPVVVRICRQSKITPAEKIEAGYPGSCAVFVVDDRVVVKLFPPLFPGDFLKEREVYRLMANRLAYMPRLLGQGIYHDQIDWPYLILEYRPGEPIRELYQLISSKNKLSLAREVGRAIRIIHETPIAGATQFDIRPDAWRRFLQERRLACLAELRQEKVFAEPLLAEIESFLESVELLTPGFELMLVNGDLTADHLLLVERNGIWSVSALIDWADAEVGNPEYEWIALWFGLCDRDALMFREILAEYDPKLLFDEVFHLRMVAFTFLHRFGVPIIRHVARQDGYPRVDSLAELQRWLWPLV